MKLIFYSILFALLIMAMDSCKRHDEHGNEIECQCVSSHEDSYYNPQAYPIPDGNGGTSYIGDWVKTTVCDQEECEVVRYAKDLDN